MNKINDFYSAMNVLLLGASGGIGQAMSQRLLQRPDVSKLILFSRCRQCSEIAGCDKNITYGYVDLCDSESISRMGGGLEQPLDLVIFTSGWLHGNGLFPEKRLTELNADQLVRSMQINAIGPMLAVQALVPHLRKGSKTVIAILSARVSSISDNRLGGWYGYRASKAALNMFIRTAAIELQRTHPDTIIAGLHPGTVDTPLSVPFQRRVPDGKLFSPDQAAEYLINVISNLVQENSGRLIAWDGAEIIP